MSRARRAVLAAGLRRELRQAQALIHKVADAGVTSQDPADVHRRLQNVDDAAERLTTLPDAELLSAYESFRANPVQPWLWETALLRAVASGRTPW